MISQILYLESYPLFKTLVSKGNTEFPLQFTFIILFIYLHSHLIASKCPTFWNYSLLPIFVYEYKWQLAMMLLIRPDAYSQTAKVLICIYV